MPSRKRKDEGEIRVSVVVEARVNEADWRLMCEQRGINLTGQNIAAHVGRSVKAGALKSLTDLGFPQEEQ
ncbi:hypothetical protein Mbo2_080 [Rhodococcus phage Mbo2]|uniref:Uncharacterized protein n=1 Tax=Rhodococcus phage Mbo2 TaxID=2936911 RepID=A0A9E7IFP7_9CAUD|nr:hypothetical protein Mbo2_080 [Rhodococcus phage Mbo2]